MPGKELNLMQAMYQKMDWLEARQKLLSQNISNADTPGYSAHDLKPIEFKNLLRNSASKISLAQPSSEASGTTSRTDAQHLELSETTTSSGIKKQKTDHPYEVSPTNNGVILEEQLMKMNETMMDHRFITNLYQKNIEMIKTSTRAQ